MKKYFFLLITASALSIGFIHSPQSADLKNGDIVFQTTESSQCKAVQLATHSPYSHCGIIYIEGDKVMVYEAVQPVKLTPLKEWVKHGKNGKYVAKRLKNASSVLTPEVMAKMKKAGDQYKNKNYDIYFGWSDDLIYCSELVWKIYKEGAGIEVGKPKKLKDFDLTSAPVKAKLQERYGNSIPYEETVVAPSDIFDSELLETVN